MPRISAPTVGEHRERQRRALLDAATALLVEQGLSGITPGAVGERAGLARSSVYQYFDSGAAIVAAVVEDAFPRANAELAAATSAAGSPVEAVDAYVATWLRLCVAGEFRPLAVLSAAEVPRECLDRLDELYELQAEPLLRAVRAARVPDAALSTRLVRGMLRSAMEALHAGAAPRTVTRRTRELVHAALGLG